MVPPRQLTRPHRDAPSVDAEPLAGLRRTPIAPHCREPARPRRGRQGAQSGVPGGRCAMAGPATLRPPRRVPRWQTLAAAVLLTVTGCSGAADTPSSPRSTPPPPTPTGTTVPAFDRGRFGAAIPLPGAGTMAMADGVLWVLASSTVVRIDPETNAAVGKPLPVLRMLRPSPSVRGRCGSPASPRGTSARPARTR
jgi:hypothetical protein